jgi:hypothetical protein
MDELMGMEDMEESIYLAESFWDAETWKNHGFGLLRPSD